MPSRRDVCLGLACAGSLGVAELMKPRHERVLIPQGALLTDLVPERWQEWRTSGLGDIVMPRTEGSLAARLYGDQLARLYQNVDGGRHDVMLLIAHGPTQTQSLQLHRPESCYPAAGFEIVERRFTTLAASGPIVVPAVALTAWSSNRTEDIIYWTRIGRWLPRSPGEQRMALLRGVLSGYIDDGVLVRASAVRTGNAPVFSDVRQFLSGLIDALPRPGRIGLIGS